MTETKVKFLGHTAILIEHSGTRIVIDPNFGGSSLFIKRQTPPSFDPFELHNVEAVLFSNPRTDRMNQASLKYFKQRKARLVLAKGLAGHMNRFFNFPMTEVASGQEFTIGEFAITALASFHTSFRFLKKYSVALNFLIKTPDKTIFYGSDAKYDKNFYAGIGENNKIDLAILPIDFLGTAWLNRGNYLSISEALSAFQDLKAAKLLPNAYGAFAWQGQKSSACLKVLQREMDNDRSLKEKVVILEPGASLTL
jgi:L-ascorbate metabolism protein UlaG (beta-lactamase superfamily)